MNSSRKTVYEVRFDSVRTSPKIYSLLFMDAFQLRSSSYNVGRVGIFKCGTEEDA
jgi:hypothetical protein